MILVVGATGTLGGMITRRLLAQGREVRILVRNGLSARPLVAAGARPVVGDLKTRLRSPPPARASPPSSQPRIAPSGAAKTRWRRWTCKATAT